jgi:hypothetical protein
MLSAAAGISSSEAAATAASKGVKRQCYDDLQLDRQRIAAQAVANSAPTVQGDVHAGRRFVPVRCDAIDDIESDSKRCVKLRRSGASSQSETVPTKTLEGVDPRKGRPGLRCLDATPEENGETGVSGNVSEVPCTDAPT